MLRMEFGLEGRLVLGGALLPGIVCDFALLVDGELRGEEALGDKFVLRDEGDLGGDGEGARPHKSAIDTIDTGMPEFTI